MKNRFNKELAFNLIYLIPFYLANKLAQIFRLLQGGDFIDKVITSFANLSFLAQHPWLSFKLQDLLIGLIAAGLLKLIVVIRSQNRKKFRKGVEYGSARWGTAKDIAPYIDKNPRNNIPKCRLAVATLAICYYHRLHEYLADNRQTDNFLYIVNKVIITAEECLK